MFVQKQLDDLAHVYFSSICALVFRQLVVLLLASWSLRKPTSDFVIGQNLVPVTQLCTEWQSILRVC